MKKLLLFLPVMLCCLQVLAKPVGDPEEDRLIKDLLSQKNGKAKVDALVNLSQYYIRKSGEDRADLDKGMRLAEQAKELSAKLKYTRGYNAAMIAIATDFIERGDSKSAWGVANSVSDSTKIDVLLILSAYHYYGGQVTEDLDSSLLCSTLAEEISRKIGMYDREAKSVATKLFVFFARGDSKSSIEHYERLIRINKSYPVPDMHRYLSYLSLHHLNDGNVNLGYYYSVQAIKTMEQTNNYTDAYVVYDNMSTACRQSGQFAKAIEYLELVADIHKKNNRIDKVWEAKSFMADALLKMNKPKDAIDLINRTAIEYPPAGDQQKMLVFQWLGNAYRMAKQFDLSEKNLMEAWRISKKKKEPDFGIHRDIGQMYVESFRYKEAEPFLRVIFPEVRKFGLSVQSHYYYLLYKVDSAAGDYLGSLTALRRNKDIDDSVWQESKSRHMREIQIQYETEKKDQAIKLKEQNILLLSRQAQLREKDLEKTRLQLQFESVSKEQSLELARLEASRKDNDLLLQHQKIELLKKEGLLQQSSLDNATMTKNVTFLGIILLLIILGLLFNQYRTKQRNSRQLDIKNQSLQKLVDEKELLLKEVHHRVKNNLHTIISLLETQSAYLKDDALAAVQNSQHRVYAMSLIHQKLYQIEDSTNINMAVYLPELVNYLRDSFDLGTNIRFKTNIEDIQLDISQAIPAGLILNEAITNSIKYAFGKNGNGVIEIEMTRKAGRRVCFSVADNGIGLPDEWELVHKNSLGLKLMKGLSDDIQADFIIENKNGTKIIVEFEQRIFSKRGFHVHQSANTPELV